VREGTGYLTEKERVKPVGTGGVMNKRELKDGEKFVEVHWCG